MLTSIRQTLRSALARRMLLALAVFGVFITLALSALQLHGDFSNAVRDVERQLDEVPHVYLKPIANATWSTNNYEVQILLDGITWHTQIEYAAVLNDERVQVSSGKRVSKDKLERRYPLVYSQLGKPYSLGTLLVVGGLDPVHRQFKRQAIESVAYRAVVISLLAILVFLLLNQLVTRHIQAIAEYVHKLNWTKTEIILKLNRNTQTKPDELDELVAAINGMQVFNREALANLHERENHIHLLLDSTEEGIYGVDTAGICTFANAACLRMLGYDNETDLVGKAIHDLIHHSYPDRRPYPNSESGVRRSTLQGETSRADDEVHWRRDGSSFPVDYRSHPIYAEGKLVGAVVTFSDISDRTQAREERDKLQAQLLQSQKMESIGQLTGGIAHDFNNMLGAILGYAELIKQIQTSNAYSPERTQKYVEEIIIAGNRAKELIAQMLVFSRLRPDMQDADVPLTLLRPVINEVAHLLRSSIPSTIEVKLHIADEALQARIHPVQLHQVLLNLAINARDVIGEYGRIDITLVQGPASGSCDSCHQDFSGDYLDLSVNDSGTGISKDILPKIFDPFFTTKEVGKGTGMGLSVVHGIVHALGGHIAVSSSQDHGSTIRILLPVVPSAAAETQPLSVTDTPAVDETLTGLRIMVVDDELVMASMLQALLSLHGALVCTYSLPHQALAAFKSKPNDIDLVITDVTMPELSGMDMAKAMLQLRPGLPVILCTGYSDQVNEVVAKESGVAAFLYKPLDTAKLLHWIRDRFAAERTVIKITGKH